MPTAMMANAGNAIQFDDLGLSSVALHFSLFGHGFDLRWYSLAYIVAIVGGWWYLIQLLRKPGAPMNRRHADDFIAWATIGVIVGGRLGYAAFYKPDMLANPIELAKLWEGGMSFHGGLIGFTAAALLFARQNRLSGLRVLDYLGVVTPIGEFTVRLANFVNGELWGRPTTVAWGIVFPGAGPEARHPSQLYEAGLEGLGMGLLLWWMFYKTDARYYPGRLAGAGLTWYAIVRFSLEGVRQPDAGLEHLAFGLTRGQQLSLPVLLIGLFLLLTSARRRRRVEPFAGTASVA